MTMEGLVPHDRGVAQPGSAPRSGRGSRRFKSSRPDQKYIDQEDLKRLSADLWEEQVACTQATGSEVAGPEAKSSRPDQKYIDQKDLKRPVSVFDSIEPRQPLVPVLPTCCRWPPAYFTVIGAPCPLSRPPQTYSRVDDLDLWLLRNGSRATVGVQKGAWLTVSDTRARARILVSGRVQGVAYRSFAQEEAWRRGLSGGVRNLADGRVEVDAEGERPVVERFIETLTAGPPMARVASVDVQWESPTREDVGFHIWH